MTDHLDCAVCAPLSPADRRPRQPRRGRPGLRIAVLLTALGVLGVPAAWARPAAAKPAAKASAASAPSAERFGFYGLSPAAAGQGLAQAEAALGQPLKVEAGAPAKVLKPVAAGATAPDCHYRTTAGQPGVRYTLAGELITRIETRDPRYATVSGVHVGDSLARAQQAYGKRLVSAPHPYFDQGRMLSVHSPDRRFALVMETNDAGRIITLRGGRLPEVGWLEGCS